MLKSARILARFLASQARSFAITLRIIRYGGLECWKLQAYKSIQRVFRANRARSRGFPAFLRQGPAGLRGVPARLRGVPARLRGVPTVFRGVPMPLHGKLTEVRRGQTS